MRLFPTTAAMGALACLTLGAASLLPTVHLDAATVQVFRDYIAAFEKTDIAPFEASGKLRIDGDSGGKRAPFESGRPLVEPRENRDFSGGSIHHFTGTIHVPGGTIEAVRRVMQDYGNYPKYFPPDVTASSGETMPDSTPADEHFHSRLTLREATLWITVEYRTLYDTHYRRVDANRWISESVSLNIKELLDPANPSRGTYPEGEDHGFLWKTNTYWFVRQAKGGIDLELNSITLSRPSPIGFGWWGTKRTREAVDKMLRDTKAAIGK